MTGIGTVLWVSAATLLVAVSLLWVVSLAIRNSSIADVFWGSGFVLVAWAAFLTADGFDGRRVLLMLLPSLWGLRLTAYLAWRNLGKGEDYRYAAMRERRGSTWWWWSYLQVFLFQGLLIWVVSLPVQASQVPASPGLGWMAAVGTAVWLVGFLFEGIADLQLARFKADPGTKGKVMDRGLWRYSRHPNYFGNFLIWWGIWIVAAEAGYYWTVIGPLLMTFLLLRVSGVAMLERTITSRRPGYAEYLETTSAFFPRPPRKG